MCQWETVIYISVNMTLRKVIYFSLNILLIIWNDCKKNVFKQIGKEFHFLNIADFFTEFLKFFNLHGEVPSEPHIFTESLLF